MAFPKAAEMCDIATTAKEKWKDKVRTEEKNRIIIGIYDCAKYGNTFYEYYPDMAIAESDLQRNWLDELCYEFEEELNLQGYKVRIIYTLAGHVESMMIDWELKTDN